MELSERLRELRKEKNETQEEVARAIGITLRHCQRFENANSNPRYAVFCALADHFVVSLDYLAGRTDER